MKRYVVALFVVLIAGALFAAPGDFAGAWTSNSPAYPHAIVLSVSGNTLTGTADGLAISRGYVDNTSVQFMVVRNGITLSYKGVVSGGTLSLQESQGNSNSRRTLTFTRSGN